MILTFNQIIRMNIISTFVSSVTSLALLHFYELFCFCSNVMLNQMTKLETKIYKRKKKFIS